MGTTTARARDRDRRPRTSPPCTRGSRSASASARTPTPSCRPRGPASPDDPVACRLDELLDPRALLLRDERADLVRNRKLRRPRRELRHEAVVQAALDVDPLDSRADLARVEERPPERPVERPLHVRV